ncbi:hypothetical protein HK098_000964 [Nowakowskiella sp. JEL0407]|nr:hypothetical protein HK098_000964 [Nowakowskiella sp. JEL0407]
MSKNTVSPPAENVDEDSVVAGLITQVAPPTEEEIAAQKSKQRRPKIEVTPTAAVEQLNPTPQQPAAPLNRPGRTGRGWQNILNAFLSCCHCGQNRELDIEKSNELNARAVPHDAEMSMTKGKDQTLSTQIDKTAPATPTQTKPIPPKYNAPSSPTGKMKHTSAIPERKWLLPPLESQFVGKKCLVLDLDETLVHSSFKPVAHADYVIPVEIDNQVHNVYVLKRPGVDTFLQRLGTQFEVVVFTASLAKYADPVLDILDKHKVVKHRLFRESCIHHKGNYVKDLSQLGRELKDVIIIDNSPASYIFHPTNAIPITSWFHDPNDTELLDLIPFLEDLKMVENVMLVLDSSNDE